jgi:hypothetical protein
MIPQHKPPAHVKTLQPAAQMEIVPHARHGVCSGRLGGDGSPSATDAALNKPPDFSLGGLPLPFHTKE